MLQPFLTNRSGRRSVEGGMTDLRDAARALRATPVVTAVAILSLALGIGANTAIFSILDSLILRALPVEEPHRLVQVTTEGANRSWTNPIWEQIRERQDRFEGAFAFSSTRFNLSQGGQAEFVDGIWASGGYFDALGVSAILGRTFGAADDRRGGGTDGPVVVIGYGFWHRRFGGAADIVGRSLTIERVAYTIIGVTPPGFFGTEVGRTFDVAIPLGTEPLIRGRESSLDRRSTWWLRIMLRLKPEQTIEAAAAALAGVQPQIREATIPENYREQDKAEYLTDPLILVPAATGDSQLRRRYQQPLTTIMVVVGLVLMIACANIANLLLARATARRHELCVRLALGASRFRLMRQLLTESLLLSGLGALLGLGFAYWGGQLLVEQLSTSRNTVHLDLSLDWRVLSFTAAVATLTAILFGTAPALRAARVQPNEAMKERGRGVVGEGRLGLGTLLVVIQVALSLVLLVGAGLFVRTFTSLANLDLGFDRGPLLVAGVDVQALQLEPEERTMLFERIRRAAAAVPGVAGAAASVVTPVSGSTWNTGVEMEGAPLSTDREREVYVNLISPDWFRAYNTRMIAGRDFREADKSGAPEVAIVNEAFARKFTNGQNPVGRRLLEPGFGARPTVHREIVGYVQDAVYQSVRDPVPPTMYLPIAQHDRIPPFVSLSVRAAAGSPVLLTRSLATAVTGIEPGVAITFRPMAEQVDNSLIQERIVAMLSGFFGALALLLAGLGLYGVTSYAVGRRRTEIGIRMALGATPGQVIAMVLSRVGLLVGAGILAGTTVAVWASRFVEALLYGLRPWDPVAVATGVVALGVIGMAAGGVPAMRAARIDPARVLRE
jgi:predicted permease